MKKKKYLFGIILMIGVLLLGSNFYQENKVITQKKNVKAEIVVDYDREFLLDQNFGVYKEDEDGNPMDVTLELVSPNRKTTSVLRKGPMPKASSESGYYKINETQILSFNELKKYLTNNQKEAIESVHTYADMLNAFGEDNVFCNDWYSYPEGNDTMYQRPYCTVVIPSVFRLDETEVPDGYSKKKVYVPGGVWIKFGFPNQETNVAITDDSEAEVVFMSVYVANNGYWMEYGRVPEEDLYGLNPNVVVDLWERYGEAPMCDFNGGVEAKDPKFVLPKHNKRNSVVDFYDGSTCPITLVNEQGEVKLDIALSVNDETTVTSTIEQQLEFKVSVRNIGTLDAYDNTVKAKLPEGFKYVEGSASDGGTYENGIVTWTVNLLEEGDNVNLTYKAYAPKEINVKDSFIGEAVILNSEIEGNQVEANKTYVKLSLNNPKTYTPLGIVALIIVMFGVGVGFALKKEKN